MRNKPKLLVYRGGALGDVLMMTPVVRQLYENHKGFCDIYVQTGFPDVFKNNPYIAGVNPPVATYDVVYNLSSGYENNPSEHAVIAYGKTAFGEAPLLHPELMLYPDKADENKVKALNYSNYIVVHMRHHDWPSRNLKMEFFQSVINQILATTNVTIIQVGGTHEIAFLGNEKLRADLGKYSIHELKCLIDGARAFIGVDGGLIHIAACTNTPLISFFTSCKAEYRMPLRASKFYPINADIDCYGCQENMPIPCTTFRCDKGNVPCIDSFDFVTVMNTIHAALNNGK